MTDHHVSEREDIPFRRRHPPRPRIDAQASLRGLLCRWPNFLIIGAAKAGTSALYDYLSRLPAVSPATTKEVHYFDLNYAKGDAWYRSHFPYRLGSWKRTITGEASPYYLAHPGVPARVARTLTDIPLIALLRNPVDRAYSHWSYWHQRNVERLSFEAVLAREDEILPEETRRLLVDPTYDCRYHWRYSYRARGHYLDQLHRWHQHVPRERVLTVVSEELFQRPGTVLPTVHDFLHLPPPESARFPPVKVGRYEQMAPATRKRLRDHFQEPNHRLTEYLGQDLPWDD